MLRDERDAALSLVGMDRSLEAWCCMIRENLARSNRHIQPASVDTTICCSDLIRIGEVLKLSVESTREAILSTILHDTDIKLRDGELGVSLDIAIQAAYMTETGVTEGHISYRRSTETSWLNTENFVAFMNKTYHKAAGAEVKRLTLADQNAIRGWKLVKKLGIELKGTNNLADHLLYNRQRNTLYFFHHVGFVIAHLRGRAYEISLESDMKTCLEMSVVAPGTKYSLMSAGVLCHLCYCSRRSTLYNRSCFLRQT
jgi:hypothetical protein